jgi:hypothetical protein
VVAEHGIGAGCRRRRSRAPDVGGEQGVGCGRRSRASEVLTVIGEEAIAINGEELVAGGDHLLVVCATLSYATVTRIPFACAFSAQEY